MIILSVEDSSVRGTLLYYYTRCLGVKLCVAARLRSDVFAVLWKFELGTCVNVVSNDVGWDRVC
jgi:hypothetical protein